MSFADESFMADVFLGELKGASEKMLFCLKSAEDPSACAAFEDALQSLRGAAAMAGVSSCAKMCDALSPYSAKLFEGGLPARAEIEGAIKKMASALEMPPAKLAAWDADLAEYAECFKDAVDGFFKPAEAAAAPKPEKAAAAAAERLRAERLKKPVADLRAQNPMFELFLIEAQNQLESLDALLVSIEGDFKNPKKLEALMRASHSLKGAARMVRLSEIVDLLHALESCFVAAQERKIALDSDSLDVFLLCADFLKTCKEGDFLNIDGEVLRAIFADLKDIAEGAFTPASASTLKIASGAPKDDAAAARPQQAVQQDASLRVSSENLNRIMSLAAESLVENRRIQPYRDALISLKDAEQNLIKQIENAIYGLDGVENAESAAANLEQARKIAIESLTQIQGQIAQLGEHSRRSVTISDRLYSEVIASRMRPFAEGVQSFPRMVRDLAKALGKKISLSIEGRNVPVDRDILENLESPIGHILRNACDHGIEPPDVRQRLGKPPMGEIRMRAWHSAGHFMLKISDDGAGVNPEIVRAKIIEKKLTSKEMLAQMTDEEILEFLFLPNFTTKESVTKLSGRGVGLDVVRMLMQEVGGRAKISSALGRGTTFTIKLPITRSVIRALIVSVNAEPYAFPLTRIHRVVRLSPSEINAVDGRPFFMLEGKRVWLADTALALGLKPREGVAGADLHAVLVADKNSLYALKIDSLTAESDLVVRPLSERLGKIAGVSSSSLTEDGLPLLILDVDDLMRSAVKLLFSQSAGDAAKRAPMPEVSKRRVLVVDDSLTVREAERQILEGAGYSVDLAEDGMDGWNCVRLGDYDLVVTDIDMPRLNGFELTRHIRGNARFKNLPIIIVSYKDRDEDRILGTEAGANAYLTKSSFQDESFLTAVKKLLEKPRAQI